MTDIMKLIERLRDDTARHDDESRRLCNQAADAIEALQAKLGELQRQEPVKFLADATRFKTTMLANGRVLINDLPRELAGRWVAFVAAENDCHLNLAAPKALEPLSEARVKEFYESLKDDKRSQNFTNENWFQCGIATAEAAYGITKGTPT